MGQVHLRRCLAVQNGQARRTASGGGQVNVPEEQSDACTGQSMRAHMYTLARFLCAMSWRGVRTAAGQRRRESCSECVPMWQTRAHTHTRLRSPRTLPTPSPPYVLVTAAARARV
mmetsp:Transcript_14478/g.42173  ORF Transcript_14478/g.42173 Transcript_14478/m.42173 type:complete len:115 (-) Transcript_14478:1021-1365(-)